METADARTHGPISSAGIDQIFRHARTHSAWLPGSVPTEVLGEVSPLAKLGPTSAYCSPARFVFLKTPQAKARLIPALAPGNVQKTQAAPVNVIIAWERNSMSFFPARFPATTCAISSEASRWWLVKASAETLSADMRGSSA